MCYTRHHCWGLALLDTCDHTLSQGDFLRLSVKLQWINFSSL